jgi:hypothetical protein
MAYDALNPWDEQQDEFSSSYFQQPRPYEQPPAPEPAPSPSSAAASPSGGPQFDMFASSVFAPGTGVDAARRGAPTQQPPAQGPSDYGVSSGSARQPPTAPSPAGMASGASSSGSTFDYGSLVDKVKTSADPRERAIAQDQLARSTFAQLKSAGHDVSWDGDNLVVDGRPYVIGDGAPAAAPAGAPTSGKTAPTAGPSLDYFQSASGRTQGGAGSPQEAYDQLAGSIDPNASPEEMEAAIEARFGHLPGYGGAYKESVMLHGQWFDLVRGYGGAGAAFQGLTPKGPSKSSSSMLGSSFAPLSPFGGASTTGGGMGGMKGARGVDLTSGLNPALLAYLRQPPPAEPDPMAPSYMSLLR